MQREILEEAVTMLKPGGKLLYSTCTFAPEENEGTISWFLEQFPQMRLLPLEQHPGFAHGNPRWGNENQELSKCVRLWPHRMEGEGHFLALLEKIPEEMQNQETSPRKDRKNRGGSKGSRPSGEEKELRKLLEKFFEGGNFQLDWEHLEIRGERIYQVPELPKDLRGIHFLRNGLFLGEWKKNRFEPSQPLALALKPENVPSALCLKADDPRVEKYLHGETIPVEKGETPLEKGWQLVCVERFSIGWGKLVNGVLKNKYLCSWRKN